MPLTAREHAERLIDNYTRNGLGDPRQSDDHAIAVAVALLDRENSIGALPELSECERKAMDAIDMTPILGTPSERLRFAIETAIRLGRKLAAAESSQKMAWNEHKTTSAIATNAMRVLRDVRQDSGLSEDSQKRIDEFLGPWGVEA